MIEGIPLDLNGIGVVGLVVLFALALGRGWIVTARELAQATHDRDEWRAESRIKDAQIAERDVQLAHLAEVGHAVNAVMRAIQKSASPDAEVGQ